MLYCLVDWVSELEGQLFGYHLISEELFVSIILDLYPSQPTAWRKCKSLRAVTSSGVSEGLCVSEKSAFPNVERKEDTNFFLLQK